MKDINDNRKKMAKDFLLKNYDFTFGVLVWHNAKMLENNTDSIKITNSKKKKIDTEISKEDWIYYSLTLPSFVLPWQQDLENIMKEYGIAFKKKIGMGSVIFENIFQPILTKEFIDLFFKKYPRLKKIYHFKK